MEPELLTTLVEEGQGALAGVRACILMAITGSEEATDFSGSIDLVRSLRGTASMLASEEFQGGLAEFETQLSAAVLLDKGLASDAGLRLLDQLAVMEATLGRKQLSAVDLHFDLAAFVDESFEALRLPRVGAPEPVRRNTIFEAPDEFDEFEIDDEMLEVFAMEAEDLLANIESSLELLSIQPSNQDALWDIRRNAHTFKGAAGIVGLRRQSELAHRIEDLLDRIVENDSPSIEKILILIHTASDLLRAMTAGEPPESLPAQLKQINVDFDNILQSLASGETQPLIAPFLPSAPAVQLITELGPPGVEHAVPELKPDRKPIIRVSLERLDDLVTNVRDLVITRSVFETLLDDLERQIDELHNGTRRLQSTCSRFEIDIESKTFRGGSVAPHRDHADADSWNFDPLEFDRFTDIQQSTRDLSETASDAFSIGAALETIRRSFESLFDSQYRLTNQMQERLMKIRMVEFGSLTTRLQRAVRITCEEEGKRAEIVIENGQLEIDTQIIDALVEPLIHLLKNAVVHGIEDSETRRLLGKPETGKIMIRLVSEDTHLVVAVSDDGKGIAASAVSAKAVETGQISDQAAERMTLEEQLALIFVPGLTTAAKLNLSAGRGVGMSIVKESIEARKGTISLQSKPQRGTTFTIRLPLPLSVTKIVLVSSGNRTFAIPAKQIDQIESMPASVITNGEGPVATFSGRGYALRSLREILGMPPISITGDENSNVLLIDSASGGFAVAISNVLRTEDVVIESLRKPLESIPGLLGAAILGSGELVPILDIPALLRDDATAMPAFSTFFEKDCNGFILVVDDSPSVRHTTSKVLQNAGWSVETAKDGLDALEKLRSSLRLPAVILSDVEMPRMDGYEFISAVKSSDVFKDIPVIFITSRSGEKHREKAITLGVPYYLPKPFDEKELLSIVTKLVAIAVGH